MREILKRLSCLSLIAFLGVSGLFINKTNASTREEIFGYCDWGIGNFDRLSYEEQANFVNTCNRIFAREEDFIDKYFNVIDHFLYKLGLEDLIKWTRVAGRGIWHGCNNTMKSKAQLFKRNVEQIVLGYPFIKQNPENLYVRAITALINETEF